MRPERLSDDFTPLMPVIYFVLDTYKTMNIYFDEVWLLFACAPLIDKDDLISASKFYSAQEINLKKPLLSVVESPSPIERSYLKDSKNILHPRYGNKLKKDHKICPKVFMILGHSLFI